MRSKRHPEARLQCLAGHGEDLGISALCEIGSHKRFSSRRVTSSDFFFFNLLWLWLKTEGKGGIRGNKKELSQEGENGTWLWGKSRRHKNQPETGF